MRRKYVVTARFPHAGGLKEGDGVHVAGKKVGEIQELKLLEDGIEVVMNVDAGVRIRGSSVATVAWGGLIGNRYVDISLGNLDDQTTLPPGSEIPTGPSIELGDVLRKVDAAAMAFKDMFESSNIGPKLSELVDNLLAIAKDIKEQRGTIGKLVASDELYKKVVGIADDLQGASARISKILLENDERIGSILEGLDAAAPEARDAFASIKRISEQIDSGKGILPALLHDEKMYEELKGALANLDTSLNRIEELTRSFQEGSGLIARLAGDEELADDFGAAVKSLKEIAKRLEAGDSTLARLTRDSDLYDDLKKLLDEARETLRSVKDQVPVGTFASVLLSAF